MAQNFEYNYVEIDPATKMCIGFVSTSAPMTETETIVEVPVNDPEYIGKFYINGSWYEDEAGTIPWTSSLL